MLCILQMVEKKKEVFQMVFEMSFQRYVTVTKNPVQKRFYHSLFAKTKTKATRFSTVLIKRVLIYSATLYKKVSFIQKKSTYYLQ